MVTYDSNIDHPTVIRLGQLREKMIEENIDWIIIYTSDPHMSEYLNAADKSREYFSGFTGSAGTLLVGQDMALLWTDSRYFVQAKNELAGSGITLMKEGDDDVESINEFLSGHVWDGQVIGIDLKTISISGFTDLKGYLPDNAEIIDAAKIINSVWTDKPKRNFVTPYVIDDAVAGKSVESKINELRAVIDDNYADIEESYTYIVSDLCSIMWLLNVRGNDIPYVPVAYSYLTIDRNCVTLFCNKKALDNTVKATLADRNIIVKEYGTFYSELDNIATDIVIVDPDKTNEQICEKISSTVRIIEGKDCILIPKHIKNREEILGMKCAHHTDAAIFVRFIMQLKEQAKNNTLSDEFETGNMLDELRLSGDKCRGLSFETICAYGTNAAIVHYSAQKDNCKKLENSGFVLVDSGAHYEMGTTDITRTIALGELSDEEKRCYTAVLKGNLELMNTVFPKGIRGDNLDSLCRRPIWNSGYNYGHGTGHGIGCLLSVHEEPVRISYRASEDAVLEPGVIVSDEPGIYVENSFGIRLENALLVTKVNNVNGNDFYGFESLTLVPFDRDAIEMELMSDTDISRLNDYHKRVYDEISPKLDENGQAWLADACAPIIK